MKKIISFLLVVALVMPTVLKSIANEGMWLPNLIKSLNYADMQKLGCKLTPEQIYDINHASIKDAIFQLGHIGGGEFQGFCTGEIVSGAGLLFTNHHCGYDAAAKLSSVEHDYLSDGYWAKAKDQELSAEGLCVSHLIKIETVTEKILKDVTVGMDESARKTAIKKAIAALEKETKESLGYEAKVKEMYLGNEYYLFVYEIFKDVRMVGFPPSSIGKFGGDTDNWMWPRHTGDFSIFRVYATKDGKPSAYSKDNVPYVPLHSLPISIKGVKQNDFTMIMGYPGTTERYLTSFGMNYKMTTFNPILVNLIGKKLEIWKEAMDKSDAIRIALASGYASYANTYKNFKGELLNLKQTDAISTKRQIEADFTKWVDQSTENKKRFGNVLTGIDSCYKKLCETGGELFYASQALLQGSSQVMLMQSYNALNTALENTKENKKQIDELTATLKKDLDEDFKDYYSELDMKVFSVMLKMYCKDISAEKQLKFFTEDLPKNYKGANINESIDKFVNDVATKSIFTDKARLQKFLDKPSKKALSSDPLLKYAQSIFATYQLTVVPQYLAIQGKLKPLEREFEAGLMLSQPNKKFYPDANSTFRVTYGTVQPYDPRDGAHYKFMTYLDGIMEKMDNTNDEFKVPAKLVELYKNKDYGQYADENGKMPVGFISDNDITGGNSGSPIMNGNGELVGLAFDGNWEWLCGNLVFNQTMQRTINVDSRYVLFIIDKFAGAHNIIEELDIRKN
ncbi:MAG: S46 family peptidase [Bacteroidia bacterium]|nr:S46 family peptidase [Bacteroidia bacterium]